MMQCSRKGLVYPRSGEVAGPGRDKYTGWGLVDATKAVQWAQRHRFAVQNASGENIFSIDEEGNFAINGNVAVGNSAVLTPDPAVHEFIVQDDQGDVMARLDSAWDAGDDNNPAYWLWPTLNLKGCLLKNQENLDPPEHSFIIENPDGEVVAYISSQDDEPNEIPAGSLVLAKDAFIGYNPDPDAWRTHLVLYDKFDDGDYADDPTMYCDLENCCYYKADPPGHPPVLDPPEWDPPAKDTGEWHVHDKEPWELYNDGEYTINEFDTDDMIAVEQPHSDVDINIDLKCTAEKPVNIIFRETSSRKVYVTVDTQEDKLELAYVEPGYPPVSIATWQRDPQNPKHPSLDFDTWYEVHIQAVGTTVRIWFRELYDEGSGGEGELWFEALDKTKDETLPQGDQSSFSLIVEHDETTNGRWRFDNVTINTWLSGDEPELECNGCGP